VDQTLDKVNISFEIASNDYSVPLCFSLLCGNDPLVKIESVTEKTKINIDTDIEHGNQQLKFVLSDKKPMHTVIDNDGNIVSDVYLSIIDFQINNIDLGYAFIKHCVYHHDFNGTQDKVEDKFYGTMGCNGTVIFEFNSPFYIWILENF